MRCKRFNASIITVPRLFFRCVASVRQFYQTGFNDSPWVSSPQACADIYSLIDEYACPLPPLTCGYRMLREMNPKLFDLVSLGDITHTRVTHTRISAGQRSHATTIRHDGLTQCRFRQSAVLDPSATQVRLILLLLPKMRCVDPAGLAEQWQDKPIQAVVRSRPVIIRWLNMNRFLDPKARISEIFQPVISAPPMSVFNLERVSTRYAKTISSLKMTRLQYHHQCPRSSPLVLTLRLFASSYFDRGQCMRCLTRTTSS